MAGFLSLRIRKDKVIPSIKIMGFIALGYSVLTFILSLILTSLDTSLSSFFVIDATLALIILLLGIGIFFKNRFCAYFFAILFTLLFFTNIVIAIFSLIAGEIRGFGILNLILLPFVLRGAKATFVYHKYIKKH